MQCVRNIDSLTALILMSFLPLVWRMCIYWLL